MKYLTIFLRDILKLSSTSPIPALHFLLGELPIEARVHLDIMSLFYNIWMSKDNTVFRIVQYLLKMTDNKSTT